MRRNATVPGNAAVAYPFEGHLRRLVEASRGEGFARQAAAFPPLPVGNVVPLTVNEFVSRAGWDSAGTLNGRTVSLTGFVVHTQGNTLLARLVISCCAADAFPVTVRLRGGGADHLASDAWIQVTGQVVPGTATRDNSYTPDFTAASVTPVATPKDPYEY